MLAKSLTLSSDNITYDLEDAVTESAKPAARTALRAHLESLVPTSSSSGSTASRNTGHHSGEIAVRINAVSSRHALADLTELGPLALAAVDAIVVPKVDSAADLTFVSDVVRHILGTRASDRDLSSPLPLPKLIALIESARAVMDLHAICSAGRSVFSSTLSPVHAQLDGLIFAAEDFALDLSISRTPSLTEFQYARSAVVTAARAFRLTSALDLVCTAFRGDRGMATLADECRNGRGMGFTGKQCIHPSQVAVIQQVFGRGAGANGIDNGVDESDADRRELAWAVRVLVAAGRAAAAGRGAFVLDGAMIDAPVVGKAQQLVSLAERAGSADYLATLHEQYCDQEPE
ncbi:carbon-carbon lyase [Grosmannia clavigera kw1407]|uniref:Carbon-carbon lyase n=1 Tax=Grosmannia clavigera (strain kw1407 / UAMH 11150) TaxID=655863 RepID=F0XSD2_GROCL|nr:carbon-carbon lyase [Grosmannia clavigera kw1407]EFW99524.1 carbon-carbon lyase [Grosmannia clavigera kw1407]